MTEAELALTIGTWTVANWKWIVGAVVATIGTTATVTWFLSKLINDRELRMLNSQLSDRSTQYSEYQTLMNERVSGLRRQTDDLRRMVAPPEKMAIDPPESDDLNDLRFSRLGPASEEEAFERRTQETLLDAAKTSKALQVIGSIVRSSLGV